MKFLETTENSRKIMKFINFFKNSCTQNSKFFKILEILEIFLNFSKIVQNSCKLKVLESSEISDSSSNS
jgi:hypothetical protein